MLKQPPSLGPFQTHALLLFGFPTCARRLCQHDTTLLLISQSFGFKGLRFRVSEIPEHLDTRPYSAILGLRSTSTCGLVVGEVTHYELSCWTFRLTKMLRLTLMLVPEIEQHVLGDIHASNLLMYDLCLTAFCQLNPFVKPTSKNPEP